MAKPRYYAVARGRRPGIYSQWDGPDGAEAQVKGFAKAAYKGFPTRAEAESWLSEFGQAESPAPARRSPAPSAPPLERFDHRPALQEGKVVMYTDGACLDNPGPGGYGVVLLSGRRRRELSGGFRLTTNNRMELRACIEGLRALKRSSRVVLYTDSRYLVGGTRDGRAERWRERGWRKSDGKPVENVDLWAQLLELCEAHEVEFVWVRGHSGTRENERCDWLSLRAATRKNLPEDTGYLPAASPKKQASQDTLL